jgi:hypothetical protein
MKIKAEDVLNDKTSVSILSKQGKVIEVARLANGVSLQPINVFLQYDKLAKYATWEDADKALGDGYVAYQTITKNKNGDVVLNRLISKAIQAAPNNPYTKDAQKKTVEVPQESLQQQPIFEQQEEWYQDIPSPSRNKLENSYVTSGLGYGDRMRMISPQGELTDVIWMPDGMIAVQNITTKIEYGQMQKYQTWDEANQVLQGWDLYKAIVASKSRELLVQALKSLLNKTPTMNPYEK